MAPYDRESRSASSEWSLVGKQVQIIVLTCREQLFEGVGGQHLSWQLVDTGELDSA